MPLTIAILFCLLHCSFGKDSTGNNEFCDMGPPGRYCFPDLTGWHECVVDKTTGKMIDKLHVCPPKTRCVCFDGPSCPGSVSDPCQPYKLPPALPPTFTMESNGKKVACSPMGCITTYFSTEQLQLADESKSREDLYEHEWLTTFILPRNGSLAKFGVQWNKKLCAMDGVKTFPRLEVPPYFSYNGMVAIGYRYCEQWIWKTGGHNQGQPTSFEAIYITNVTDLRQKFPEVSGDDQVQYVPVMIENIANLGPVAKQSLHRVTNITSFLIGEVDKKKFIPPSFCPEQIPNP